MAGIAGIGNTNPNLFQLLTDDQNDPLTGTDQPTQLAAIEALLEQQATSTDPPTQDSQNSLQAKITEAVLTAIQDAEKSGQKIDLKQVIQDAVAKALKEQPSDTSAQDLASTLLNSLNGGKDLLGYLFDSQQ
jgi:hypothetical protein